MQGELWWSYWYFHLPNYAFAVLFWTLIGRFMFGFFLPPDSPNYIYRWFRRLTEADRGLQAGADLYVTKPFSNRELLSKIEGLLSR
jgi:hypothetical protein